MDIKQMNRKLSDLYGRQLDGSPNFRIVWSTSQTEKRWGTRKIFYGSIFVREEKGVFEEPKYPTNKDRWVLERKIPLHPIQQAELQLKMSYEPIFVFKDKEDNFKPVVWDAVVAIMHWLLYRTFVPKTLKDHAEEYEKKIRAEQAEVYGYLNEMLPMSSNTTLGNLHYGRGIVVPNTYQGANGQSNGSLIVPSSYS